MKPRETVGTLCVDSTSEDPRFELQVKVMLVAKQIGGKKPDSLISASQCCSVFWILYLIRGTGSKKLVG